MKCYDHDSVDAVGICKSCQKGLCRQCAVDLGKGLACRGRCEAAVSEVIALIDSNIQHLPTTRGFVAAARRTGLISSGFLVVMGVLFFWWGIRSGGSFDMLSIMGIAFLAFGLIHFVRTLRVAPVQRDSASRGDAT